MTQSNTTTTQTAFLFDLDGTLVDSVYQHVLAWRDALERYASQVRPLPGATELLSYLTEKRVPWAIATSGHIRSASLSLQLLGISEDVPIITRDLVTHAKPDPDLFIAAAEKLGVDCSD